MCLKYGTSLQVARGYERTASRGQWPAAHVSSSSLRGRARLLALLPPGMGFAVAGKHVIGPRFLLGRGLGRGICRGRAKTGWAIPIRRRIGDPPYISGVVQRHSDKKIFPVATQGQAICYTGRSASTTRQTAQQYRSLQRQGLRRAESAALRAYHQSNALRG